MAALRIGLLGGSFDPPHLGHRALAQSALSQLALDELRWLPAGDPWQKAGRALAAPEHRLAMVRLMAHGLARCEVDERELRRAGPTYTIDTVRELQAQLPQAQCILILGQDQFARLHTWREWRSLVGLVQFAVVARDGQAPQADAQVAALAPRVQVLHMPPVAVSATAVRQAAAQARALAPLVGEAVAGYIELHHLYRGTAPH